MVVARVVVRGGGGVLQCYSALALLWPPRDAPEDKPVRAAATASRHVRARVREALRLRLRARPGMTC